MTRALAIGCLFFLSGLTSLVYQSLWVRVLSLGVGSTSTSLSLVLSIFFFGLALGSWGAGRIAHRVRRPVLAYGVLEGIIGLYSLLLLPLLFRFQELLALLPLHGSLSWLGTTSKFTAVLLLLALPTTLMGASLPILIRIFVRSGDALGKKISLLYGVNTLGAVVGAFLTGFALIPSLGVATSNTAAALANFFILLLAIALREKSGASETPVPTVEATRPTGFQRLLPWVVAATGFSALVAEVVWNKYLGIFLGSNVFGLSLILALFLLGIALGSFALSFFIEKVKRRETLFQALLAACTLSLFATTWVLNLAPVAANVVSYYFPGLDLFKIKAVLAAIMLFPPGAILGALLPLAIRLRIEEAGSSAAVAGRLYAVNTIGSIVGSCAAGLLLIPLLGSNGAIQCALAALLLAGLVLSLTRRQWIGATAQFLLLALVPFSVGLRFENIIKSAYYQHVSPNLSFTEVMRFFAKDYEEFQLIVEGKTGIISLSHDPADGPGYREFYRLKTNGLNESVYDRNNLDLLPKYEALLGFLPFAFSRNPEKAFVVGYGGGYTVDFLTSTDIDEVWVAELEAGILRAADHVYRGKNPLLQRKNLRLEIEDARYLLATRALGPFDIIVSQPSHSWLSGVANLFTEEFFLVVRENLAPRGIFSQWLNLYNMNPEVLKSILRTFYSVFPHGYVFTGADDQELIMIGSSAPLRFDRAKLDALVGNPRYQRQLSQIPVRDAYDVLAQFALSREEILRLTAGARLNTDRNAFAEVTQSRLFYSERNSFPSRFLLEAFSGDYSSVVNGAKDAAFYEGLLQAFAHENQRAFKTLPILARYQALAGENEAVMLAAQMQQMERYASATELLRKNTNAAAFAVSLSGLIASGQRSEAARLWMKHPSWRSGTAACFGPELFAAAGDHKQARAAAAQLEAEYERQLDRCGPYLNKALGLHHFAERLPARAISYLEAYYSAAPTDLEAYRVLLAAYILEGDQANAQSFFSSLESLVRQERERLMALAEFYDRKGFAQDAKVLRKKAEAL